MGQTNVEEANEITEELRGGELTGYEFKAHVMADIEDADHDPAIAITLYVHQFGEGSPKSNKKRKSCSVSRSVRAIFTIAQFRLRLEALRDLYHEVECRSEPWGVAGDLDPWSTQEGVPRLSADVLSVRSGSARLPPVELEGQSVILGSDRNVHAAVPPGCSSGTDEEPSVPSGRSSLCEEHTQHHRPDVDMITGVGSESLPACSEWRSECSESLPLNLERRP